MKKIVSLVLTAVLALSAAFISVPSSNVEAATKAKSQKTVKLVTESYDIESNSTTKYTYYKNGLLKSTTSVTPGYSVYMPTINGGEELSTSVTTTKQYYYNSSGSSKGQLKKIVTSQLVSGETISTGNTPGWSSTTHYIDNFTITSTDTFKYKKSKLKEIKTVTIIPTYPVEKWYTDGGHYTDSGWEAYHSSSDTYIKTPPKAFITSNPSYSCFILSYDWNTNTYKVIFEAEKNDYFGIETQNKDDCKKITTIKKFSYKSPTRLTVKSKTNCIEYKTEAMTSFEKQYGDDGYSYTTVLVKNDIKKSVYRLCNNHSTSEYYFNQKGFLTKRNYDAFDETDPTFSSSYSYRYDKNNQLKKIKLSTYTGFDYLAEGYNDYRKLKLDLPYRLTKTYENIGGDYFLNYIGDAEKDDTYINDEQVIQLTAKQIRLSSPKFKKAKVSSFYSQKVKDQQYKLLNQVNTINTFGL